MDTEYGSDYLKLDQLEQIYMDGMADEVSGDVDSPMGHFYRVCRQIVVTSAQGVSLPWSFDTEDEAREAFQELAQQYADWA